MRDWLCAATWLKMLLTSSMESFSPNNPDFTIARTQLSQSSSGRAPEKVLNTTSRMAVEKLGSFAPPPARAESSEPSRLRGLPPDGDMGSSAPLVFGRDFSPPTPPGTDKNLEGRPPPAVDCGREQATMALRTASSSTPLRSATDWRTSSNCSKFTFGLPLPTAFVNKMPASAWVKWLSNRPASLHSLAKLFPSSSLVPAGHAL
mmetsp:Transcript_120583/g.237048  ORF Transcript_120583/g.237048 Transcript_120583/m.237048 type:complete len:204 (+) Transcript_120583:686-1297(+)